MQMDPAFAASVFRRDADALLSLELCPDDLELLLALDPLAVSADREDQRKRQLEGNLASEHALAVAYGPADLLPGFLGSPEFHAAIQSGGYAAVAFGAYAARRAADLKPSAANAAFRALVELERAMVSLRRRRTAPPLLAPGELRLAPRAALCSLPAGALHYASRLREALERGEPLPAPALAPGEETVLLVSADAGPHALGVVQPELLEPPVARLLRAAERGLPGSAQAELAAELDSSLDELRRFAAGLVAEGVLLAG